MRNFIINFILASSFLFSHLLEGSPPQPIQGVPGIMAKAYNFGAGGVSFSITPPSGWGMGEMSVSPTESSHFVLFPSSGGYGCTIDVIPFENDLLAKEALEASKKRFKRITPLGNGFEAELKKGWYCCSSDENYLVKIWYMLPKKRKNETQVWNQLKQCLVIQKRVEQAQQNTTDTSTRPPVEKTNGGWVFHHPENKIDLFFAFPWSNFLTTSCLTSSSLNSEPNQIYQIEFENFHVTGYFFVKWNQTNLDTEAPYKQHLQEMIEDVKKMETSQNNPSQFTLNLAERYAYAQGSPYTMFTLAGDEFLFGFAIKPNTFLDYDVNNLIKLVSWDIY